MHIKMAEGRRKKKVAIIGAGIIGLSTAIRLQNADPSLDVTIIAEHFSPNTTSDGAAGFWEPFCNDSPMEKLSEWGKKTFDYLKKITSTEKAGSLGIFPLSGYELFDQKMEKIDFDDIYTRTIRLQKDDLEANFPNDIVDGYFVTSLLVTPTPYLQMSMKQFQQNGGECIKKKVKSFDEFVGKYDVVVNCTGLGSNELCNDNNVQPIRGQILKVKAPWIKHFYGVTRKDNEKKEKTCYILPRAHDVVIGGTTTLGDWNTGVSVEDTEFILKAVSEIEPSLKNAEIIGKWAGLRPARSAVRLEKEVMKIRTKYGATALLQVVHNYGHGGGGLSLFWGCAEEARDLVLNSLLHSAL